MTKPDRRIDSAWGLDEFDDLLHDRHQWLIFRGGRASAKSTTACQIALLRGNARRLRILCLREYQRTLDDSVMALMLKLADQMKLRYRKRDGGLDGPRGTRVLFRGLSDSTGTARSIRSLDDVDLVLLEEAQDITDASLKSLVPTIRKQGFGFIACYNPRFAEDPIHVKAESGSPHVRVVDKYYTDNSALSADALAAIDDFRQLHPTSFAQEYLGQLVDADDEARILQPLAVEAAREAFASLRDVAGDVHAGWDVADTGGDRNALAIRSGPNLLHVEAWEAKRPETIADSARRVIRVCQEHGVSKLHFDAGGVGAAATAVFNEDPPDFACTGVHAGGRVTGPETPFVGHHANKTRFFNRYAQLAWTLRLRADNTRRLANGEDVDPALCLGIARGVGRTPDARDLDRQLLQPIFAEPSGKIRVDKAPAKAASPDMFDAAALAFADDSRDGLTDRLQRWDLMGDWRAKRDARLRAKGLL